MAPSLKSPTIVMAVVGLLAWILLLAGVGAMQARCGDANYQAGGVAGYLGPVQCSTLFSYTWWITFLGE
jgi:hypothetical protein